MISKKDVTQCVTAAKHGQGPVMACGYISASGVGDLVKSIDINTTEMYGQILIHHVVPSAKYLISRNFNFQYDNDPKHTDRAVKDTGTEKHPIKHCQSWIGLSRSQTSKLLKQCGIILIGERTKVSQHSRKSFECLLRSPENNFWRPRKEITRKHIFHTFLAKYKEMLRSSRLLHSTACARL